MQMSGRRLRPLGWGILVTIATFGMLPPSSGQDKSAGPDSKLEKARADDVETIQAEVKKLHDELHQKHLEVRDLKKRLAETEKKLHQARREKATREADMGENGPIPRAEKLIEQARAKRKAALQFRDPEEQQREEKAARDLFRQAGAIYEKAVTDKQTQAQKAGLLLKAIGCYRETSANDQVIALWERYLKIAEGADRLGGGWYLLGEARRQEKQQAEAEKAYKQCLEYQTPFAYRARYQLGVMALDSGRLDDAAYLLSENLALFRQDAKADAEAREKTLFALGRLHFERKKYLDVVIALEAALGLFPDSAEAPRAHFQLAQAYRQRAIEMNSGYLASKSKDTKTREHFSKEYRNYLEKAASEFYELAQLLDDNPEKRNGLTGEECIDVPFQAAECRFYMGKYDEALKWYEALAQRHKGNPEELKALAGSVRCLAALKKPEEAKKHLEKIRKALDRLDGDVKEQWEAWLRKAMP